MASTPIVFVDDTLDNPPEFAAPLIRAMGIASLAWARLEQHLDCIIISVNKEHFAKAKYRETPNTSIRLKAGVFENWFVEDPRFAQFHQTAADFLKGFRSITDDRNFLLHSNLNRFEPGPPPLMIVTNLFSKGGTLTQSRGEFSEKVIKQFSDSCLLLNRTLWEISQHALQEPFLQSLHKGARQTPRGIPRDRPRRR